MVSVGILARLEAKPGKEADVEAFLRKGLEAVKHEEPGTVAWFALRLGPSTFGVFDAFEDEAGRQAHMNGSVAGELVARMDELLASPPTIERPEIFAVKLPG